MIGGEKCWKYCHLRLWELVFWGFFTCFSIETLFSTLYPRLNPFKRITTMHCVQYYYIRDETWMYYSISEDFTWTYTDVVSQSITHSSTQWITHSFTQSLSYSISQGFEPIWPTWCTTSPVWLFNNNNKQLDTENDSYHWNIN